MSSLRLHHFEASVPRLAKLAMQDGLIHETVGILDHCFARGVSRHLYAQEVVVIGVDIGNAVRAAAFTAPNRASHNTASIGNGQGLVMISPNRPWIFVHIQKTGGTAVRSALGIELYAANKHFLARELKQICGEAVWADSFKFAFVRNPWDRLVSWWSMMDAARNSCGSAPPNNFLRYVLQRASSFEEFISRCTDEIVDTDGRKHIFRNQIDYLVDENGAVIVDFIGRFERLQDCFDEVTARLGLPGVELPRLNASRHGAYTDYYTPAMAEAVGHLYARDIEMFGYRFGE